MTPAPETRVCVTCGGTFAISATAAAQFAMRDTALPKRCWPCRCARRPRPAVTVYVAPAPPPRPQRR